MITWQNFLETSLHIVAPGVNMRLSESVATTTTTSFQSLLSMNFSSVAWGFVVRVNSCRGRILVLDTGTSRQRCFGGTIGQQPLKMFG